MAEVLWHAAAVVSSPGAECHAERVSKAAADQQRQKEKQRRKLEPPTRTGHQLPGKDFYN
jgi:hypothetical protein